MGAKRTHQCRPDYGRSRDGDGKSGLTPGLLHHSVKVSKFASALYQRRLSDLGITYSMRRKGDCWDNAVVERFFGTLKTELYTEMKSATRADARAAIFESIEIFYNQCTRHMSLGH